MNTPWRDDAASWRAVQLLEANAPLIRKEVYIYICVCVCAHKGCQVHTVKVARGLQAATLCARGCNPMPASLPPHSGARAARARPAHAQLRLGQPGQARAAGRVERAELHLQGCACALHVHCMCTACALRVHRMRTACTLPALYLRAPYTLRMRLPLLPPPVCVLPGTWNPRAMELLPGTFKVVTSLPEASSMVLGATKISNPNP